MNSPPLSEYQKNSPPLREPIEFSSVKIVIVMIQLAERRLQQANSMVMNHKAVSIRGFPFVCGGKVQSDFR